jgi:hypothetical protein
VVEDQIAGAHGAELREEVGNGFNFKLSGDEVYYTA